MKLAILGTGAIGSALAEAFLQKGFEVNVYNRTPDRAKALEKFGAAAMATPAQAIQASDAVILAVIDIAAIREVLFNADTKAALKGKKILNVPTVSVSDIKALAKDVSEAGGSLAEMSIRSDASDVRKKHAYSLLACQPSEKSFWEDMFRTIGDLDYVGELGTASAMVIPGIMGSALTAVYQSYAVAFGQKMGLPKEILTKDAAAMFPGSEQIIPGLWEHDYSHGFATLDGYRDTTKIAVEALKSAGLPTGVFEDIIALYDSASKKGFGAAGESSLIEALL